MDEKIAVFSPERGRDLLAMLDWWQGRARYASQEQQRPTDPTRGGTRVIMLLEDMESDGTARAARLKRERTTERQRIDLLGEPDATTTWAIRYYPDDDSYDYLQTEALPATATAAEVRAALEALDGFEPGSVRVTGGNHTRRSDKSSTATLQFSPTRWLVEFTGAFQGEATLLVPVVLNAGSADSELVFAASGTTELADTGDTMEIYGPLPVGSPSPLRQGAIGIVSWAEDGHGWVLHAVEPRTTESIY
jgi:hypothetical protein